MSWSLGGVIREQVKRRGDAPVPRIPSGKILKRALREPYWEGRARRIN